MKKGFTVILLSVFLLYRITSPTSVVHAEEVEISAPSGILMEMSTGTVLFEKRCRYCAATGKCYKDHDNAVNL